MRRWTLPALLTSAGLLAGMSVGQALAPDRPPPVATVVVPAAVPGGGAPSAAPGPGPARWQDGVPAGWAPTREGAVAAACGYLRVLSARWFLTDQARRHRAIRVLATPGAAGRLRADQDRLAARLATGPLGAGLARDEVRTVLRTGVLGARLERYQPPQAVVAVWAVAVAGNDGGLPPQSLWGTTRLSLRWTGGDWRVWQVTSLPGPTPAAAQLTPTPPAELLRQATGFQEVTPGG